MKCSDYIAKRVKREVDTVFGVTGGCIINVVDSFHKAGLKIIPMHHEQSAAIAADAYARFKGFGVCFGTSGPGTTNLTTGIACSYYDSIPVLAIGGQVPEKLLNKGRDRQFGFQEVDGVELLKPITKSSKRMTSPIDLERIILTAKSNRQGPVFLEICDDYQRANIEEIKENVFENSEEIYAGNAVELVNKAKKPLVIIGNGAREMDLDLKVPFLFTWGIKDKYFNHPYCKGDFGITGSPNGNRMIKESDLILMIGTKMDTHQCPDWEKFAPNAYKISMGLEFPHKVDMKVIGNLKNYSPLKIEGNDWGVREENNTDTSVYRFIDELCSNSNEGDIIIPDMGQIGCIAFQRWKPKKNQRLFNGMNHSPMGYSIPASIGATIAANRPVKVIIGDGSFMMNMHDLQTIKDYNLPIEIYVVNNGGYGMIRQTQNDWKQYLSQGVACNLKIPDIQGLANAFGIGDKVHEIKFEDTTIQPKWKYGNEF